MSSARDRALARLSIAATGPYAESDDGREFVIDVLTDLLHLCKLNQIDFEDAYLMAETHYRAEGTSHE